jgi:chromosome segregation ATPase
MPPETGQEAPQGPILPEEIRNAINNALPTVHAELLTEKLRQAAVEHDELVQLKVDHQNLKESSSKALKDLQDLKNSEIKEMEEAQTAAVKQINENHAEVVNEKDRKINDLTEQLVKLQDQAEDVGTREKQVAAAEEAVRQATQQTQIAQASLDARIQTWQEVKAKDAETFGKLLETVTAAATKPQDIYVSSKD